MARQQQCVCVSGSGARVVDESGGGGVGGQECSWLEDIVRFAMAMHVDCTREDLVQKKLCKPYDSLTIR